MWTRKKPECSSSLIKFKGRYFWVSDLANYSGRLVMTERYCSISENLSCLFSTGRGNGNRNICVIIKWCTTFTIFKLDCTKKITWIIFLSYIIIHAHILLQIILNHYMLSYIIMNIHLVIYKFILFYFS